MWNGSGILYPPMWNSALENETRWHCEQLVRMMDEERSASSREWGLDILLSAFSIRLKEVLLHCLKPRETISPDELSLLQILDQSFGKAELAEADKPLLCFLSSAFQSVNSLSLYRDHLYGVVDYFLCQDPHNGEWALNRQLNAIRDAFIAPCYENNPSLKQAFCSEIQRI